MNDGLPPAVSVTNDEASYPTSTDQLSQVPGFDWGTNSAFDPVQEIVEPISHIETKQYISEEDLEAMRNGVKRFAEGSVVVMKALDDLARLHPFIAATVIAFKVVINLEMKRRENNNKVVALHVQMHDTMSVLLQLRGVRDPVQILSDGTCIQGRLQRVLGQLENDIKICGNVCDKYMKKSTIAKIIKAPIYEQRLADCAVEFAHRRRDLELALNVHTAVGIQSVNLSLSEHGRSLSSIEDKLNLLLLFRQLDSPVDRELMQFIEANGGPQACTENDSLLATLQDKTTRRSSIGLESTEYPKQGLDKLKKELNEDLDTALEENMVQFERKMKMQGQQLEALVRTESDRIIEAIQAGSYDKLIDQDLKDLWREMGWRGSVKARHFVLCLYDFLSERYQSPDDTLPSRPSELLSVKSTTSVVSPRLQDITQDRRLMILQCIQVSYALPIIECIDRNGSGFISIREANIFAHERPPGWSLPDWVAYWAVAWPSSVLSFRRKIYVTVQRMFQALDRCLPLNRSLLDDYLDSYPFKRLELVLRDVQSIEDCPVLTPRLASLLEESVEGLKKNLESMAFNLDAPETVRLIITEGGPIERYFFPLFYLILENHLKIFRAAETQILHPDELIMPAASLGTLYNIMCRRVRDLQDKLKPPVQIQELRIWNGIVFGKLRAPRYPLITMIQFHGLAQSSINAVMGNSYSVNYYDDEEDIQREDGTEEPSISSSHQEQILCYGAQQPYDYSGYEKPFLEFTVGGDTEERTPSALNGMWAGYRSFSCLDSEARVQPGEGIVVFMLETDPVSQTVQGQGESHYGTSNVTGSFQPDDTVCLFNEYRQLAQGLFRIKWSATYDSSKNTLSGLWYYADHQEHGGDFCLRRTSLINLQFLPSPVLISPQERWSYALNAVLNQVRQRSWAWSFFKSRFEQRRRFVDLHFRKALKRIRQVPQEIISSQELDDIECLQRHTLPCDGRFFMSIAENQIRRIVYHNNVYCDDCGSDIVGPRYMCLDCYDPDKAQHIDLCLLCFKDGKDFARSPFSHDAKHSVMRTSRFVHLKDRHKLVKTMTAALEHARDFILNDTFPRKHCAECDQRVQLPYWLCPQCDSEGVFCNDCIVNDVEPLEPATNMHSHALVRVSMVSEAEERISTEGTLEIIQDRLAMVEDRLSLLLGMVSELVHVSRSGET